MHLFNVILNMLKVEMQEYLANCDVSSEIKATFRFLKDKLVSDFS